jgi:cyclic beta-1,2-glucan synthetase
MQKHHGHLFNWYDTQTLKPLPPDYVSSVDSGNFAGHLVAVAQACRAWRPEAARRTRRPR